MRLLIVDGTPAQARLLARFQKVRAEGVRLLEEARALEAALINVLPNPKDGDAVRLGKQVISRWRGRLRIEPDQVDLAYLMAERDRRERMTKREVYDEVREEQRPGA